MPAYCTAAYMLHTLQSPQILFCGATFPPACCVTHIPYACRTVPWGFHHFALKSLPVGFPVWFDINLSQAGASTWYTWLSEGLLLDGNTRGMVAYMVTYNADLEVFAAVRVNFDFDQGGSIRVGFCKLLLGSRVDGMTQRCAALSIVASDAMYYHQLAASRCRMFTACSWFSTQLLAGHACICRYFM